MRTIKFRDDLIDLIRRGKKTVTIRPLKPRATIMRCPDDQKYHMFWNGENLSKHEDGWILTQCPYGRIGDIMGVDGHEDIKLKITDIRFQQLLDVDYDTWARDGIKDPNDKLETRQLWASFYAGTEYDWCMNPMVWVIDFEAIQAGAKIDQPQTCTSWVCSLCGAAFQEQNRAQGTQKTLHGRRLQ